VQSYTDAQGITYYPGDIVDLPESMSGEAWLESVKEEPKPVASVSKVEPASEATPEVPLEPVEPRKPKKSRKTE
jgi:hypothetical protein